MGRFSNLEFDEDERLGQPLEHAPVKDQKYYLGLAHRRFEQGKFENALRFYSRALEFDAQLSDAWLGQVQALLELDEPNEARVWADKGLEQFRNHAEMLAAKGVALARLGELDQAMALSDAALAEKGGNAFRWRARGEVLLAREDRNEDFCFGKAMAAAPGDWFEPLAIGRVYAFYGKDAPALRYFEIAAARQAESAFLWQNFGGCLERLGMTARARKAYASALAVDRECDGAKEGLVRLDSQGVITRIRKWFRRSN